MDNQKVLAIINPKSGNSQPEHIEELFQNYFSEHPTEGEYLVTSDIQEIEDRTRQAKEEGVKLFIAAGGDGTVSIIANQLIDTDCELAIIPVGTANMIAKAWNIPEEVEEAFEIAVHSGNSGKIDGLCQDGRCFFLGMSAGLSSLIMKNTNAKMKKFLGKLGYFITGVFQFIRYSDMRFCIEIDGEEYEIIARDVVVNNVSLHDTPLYTFFKDSSPDDGIMECNIFNPKNLWDYLLFLFDMLFGIISDRKYMKKIKIHKQISIRTPKRIPFEGDGDPVSIDKLNADIITGAVRLRTPARK